MDDRPDLRKFPRIPLAAQVRIQVEGVEQYAAFLTENISEGGAFIRSDKPLSAGTKIFLSVSLRSCDTLLEAEGLVMWSRPPNGQQPGGMGVKFTEVRPEAEKVLKDITAGKIKEPLPAE